MTEHERDHRRFPGQDDTTLIVVTDRDTSEGTGYELDDWSVAELNATERRIALYWSGLALTTALRGNRARMVEIIERGAEVIGGRDVLFDVAEDYRALVRHVHRDRCPDCEQVMVDGWPDPTRARLARKLAQSAVWEQPWGRDQ